MGKELVVSSDRHETKVAILEDGQLVEVYFQRGTEYSLAGSIHKGRVTRVLPGMQSAFVDLGLERDTFLYVSDFFEEHGDDIEHVSQGQEDRRGGRNSRRDSQQKNSAPAIEARESKPQVEKEPEVRAGKAEAAVEDSSETAVADAEGQREDRKGDDDRRGRRRRRRRGSGSRFPDSKFASADDAPEAEEETQDEPVVQAQEEEVIERIILPGESLAKYKRTTAPVVSIARTEVDTEVAEDAPQLVTTVEEPDAPVHHPVLVEELETEAEVEVEESDSEDDAPAILVADDDDEDVTEQVLSQVEDTEDIPFIEADDEPIDPVDAAETEEEATSETEMEAITEETEDVVSLEEIAESEDVEVTASDDAAEVTDSAEEKEADGEESQNGSAQVRESSGGRFLQRQGRSRRRRGRGGDRSNGRKQEQESTAPAEPEKTSSPSDELPLTPRSERIERPAAPSISDLLKEGQEILVQIAKEPLGQKGARITSHIALPGRYCVYMPTVEHTGVSRKIASDEERQRLKKILVTHKAGMAGGFIIRTAGEGKSEADIAADISYLYNLWLDIRAKAEKKKAPALVYHDLDIVERTLRDQLSDDFKAIWCDTEEVYESVLRFVQRVQPALVSRIKLFTRPVAIFDAFNVSMELEKALRPKVWLKSGGYIVINQTEALVAIDINTGKFVGKSNRLEDTIVKTNTEAVKEIVRQIRLRDLGGIIVIDFIDMDERKNRQKVMQALEEAMRADRAPYKILQFNDFGLVAVTRKRVKQSLERTLCQPCPYCDGAGYVRSSQTVISDIVAEARKIAAAVEGEKECILRVNPEVAKILKSTQNTYLEEIEGILKRPVAVLSDPLIHHEKFDLS